MSKKDKAKKNTPPTLASQADKYELYLRAVQEPCSEVRFFDRAFKKEFGRKPMLLREDFCGTFGVCCQWVKGDKDRHAVGVDIDAEPLTWGREHNLNKLKPKTQSRVNLIQGDVRDIAGPKAEVLAAQNFSFWFFTTRDEVVRYFKAAYQNMASQSLMILDMMGGPDCYKENHIDQRKYDHFTYEWEQAAFNPIDHAATFYIHFSFKDGSRLDRAFTYEWRFWTIPEVREMLAEAGFETSSVYWEGTDADTGEGNGIYRKRAVVDSDPCWIAYIVAVKRAEVND